MSVNIDYYLSIDSCFEHVRTLHIAINFRYGWSQILNKHLNNLLIHVEPLILNLKTILRHHFSSSGTTEAVDF